MNGACLERCLGHVVRRYPPLRMGPARHLAPRDPATKLRMLRMLLSLASARMAMAHAQPSQACVPAGRDLSRATAPQRVTVPSPGASVPVTQTSAREPLIQGLQKHEMQHVGICWRPPRTGALDHVGPTQKRGPPEQSAGALASAQGVKNNAMFACLKDFICRRQSPCTPGGAGSAMRGPRGPDLYSPSRRAKGTTRTSARAADN